MLTIAQIQQAAVVYARLIDADVLRNTERGVIVETEEQIEEFTLIERTGTLIMNRDSNVPELRSYCEIDASDLKDGMDFLLEISE